ncbi:MAG: hypothetical protein L6V93_02365 [Clostridiales bacterium]|nr:MAG: hypothetical protein L6V93_02365 [Clostridiales bacterium]
MERKTYVKTENSTEEKRHIFLIGIEKRINTEISEDLESRNSDEESSHVVGKFSDSGGGINDTLPPPAVMRMTSFPSSE